MIWLWCSDWLLLIQMMCTHWRITSWHAGVTCVLLQFLLLSYFLCYGWVCCIQLCLGWPLYIGTQVHFHVVSMFLWWSICPNYWVAYGVWAYLTWVWVNCMFISAMLSLVKFHKVLSDLLSGCNKFDEFHYYCPRFFGMFFPPLFLLKFHFIFKFFIWLHVSMPIFAICALGLRFSNSAFVYLFFGFSFWHSSKIKDNK